MLVLTCKIGGILRIDHEIQVTLQARLRNRVTVDVLAPPDAEVYFDGVCLQPLVLPSGTRSYLFSLLAVRNFRVAAIDVGIWLPGKEVAQAAEYDDFIHVGVTAPQPVHIGYEPANLGATPLPALPRSMPLHHGH